MNRIFILMNQCTSPVGAERLYELLRRPVFEAEELKERQRLMEFFRTHETERHLVQTILSNIRRPGNVSVFEAVHVTSEVTIQGKKGQICCFAAFLLSLVCFILKPNPGVLIFLAVCGFNIATYWEKGGN